jgi:DNA-binding IclR family transcriptional regulator
MGFSPRSWGSSSPFGMVVTDALNGLWVSRLLARADARAAGASRAMSLAIALLALAIAATGAARHALPGLDERWANGASRWAWSVMAASAWPTGRRCAALLAPRRGRPNTTFNFAGKHIVEPTGAHQETEAAAHAPVFGGQCHPPHQGFLGARVRDGHQRARRPPRPREEHGPPPGTTLVEYDILEQNRESGKYRLGLALFELGTLVRRKMDAVSESRQQMSALLEMTGENRAARGARPLERALYPHPREPPGRSHELDRGLARAGALHQRGQGVARVPAAGDGEAGAGPGLRRYTANTITTPEALQDELASIRARGYAIDDEESEVGLRCVAAPIRDHTGLVAAAISVSAPVQRMTKKNLQTAVPTVVAAAEAISRRLGYLPSLAGAHE